MSVIGLTLVLTQRLMRSRSFQAGDESTSHAARRLRLAFRIVLDAKLDPSRSAASDIADRDEKRTILRRAGARRRE